MDRARFWGVVADRIASAALGPTGHADEHLEAVELLLTGKAVQLEDILPHMEVGVEPGPLPLFQLRQGIVCGGAGIAHAAAVDDGQTGGDLRHGAVEIVKHIQTVSFTSGSFRRSRDVALRAWQMAMASASAASSGRGTAFSFSSRRVISMTCRFSARP